MGSWIDCCNGRTKIAPGHKAHNLCIRLLGPFFLDVLPVKAHLKWLAGGAASLKAKETIVGRPCTNCTPAIDKELMEVRTRSVRRPYRARTLSPTGDDSAAADDRMLAVNCLPDSIAILRAEYQRLRKKICSCANRNRDGARATRATLCTRCISRLNQRLDRACGRNDDVLSRRSSDNNE